MPWQTLNTPVDVRITSWHHVFFYSLPKSVTSNTFQFRDDSESKSVINKEFCGHRLHWFKIIKSDQLFSNAVWNNNREGEKSKYLDNISVLPTSIFIFDKFVDGAQSEVADEIAGTFWEPCNEHNSYPKMSVKRPLVYSWAVVFASVDKCYIWTSDLDFPVWLSSVLLFSRPVFYQI
jgi:hypothetical protein